MLEHKVVLVSLVTLLIVICRGIVSAAVNLARWNLSVKFKFVLKQSLLGNRGMLALVAL